jgi:uncharacterized membrane protein YdfJ with MMPL/SSD domain
VITGAGIVLAATFSVLSVMQLVFMVGLGTLVALGVLIDTFVVRSIMVPALAWTSGRPRGGRRFPVRRPRALGAPRGRLVDRRL